MKNFKVKYGNETRFFETREDAKAFADEVKLDPRGIQIGPDHWKHGLPHGRERTHSHSMNDGAGDGFRRTTKQKRRSK